MVNIAVFAAFRFCADGDWGFKRVCGHARCRWVAKAARSRQRFLPLVVDVATVVALVHHPASARAGRLMPVWHRDNK
jgi:hypothetical protein